MHGLTLQDAIVRVAAFPEGDRLLTVRATCFGPEAEVATARLVPRRHAAPPPDGLWDIDLVSGEAAADGGPVTWRTLTFTGEADWCEGVRLHSAGAVLEHRMAPHPARLAPRPIAARGWTPPAPPSPPARRRFDLFRLALDGTAAAMILAGLALLPLALPANASEPAASLHGDRHHHPMGTATLP